MTGTIVFPRSIRRSTRSQRARPRGPGQPAAGHVRRAGDALGRPERSRPTGSPGAQPQRGVGAAQPPARRDLHVPVDPTAAGYSGPFLVAFQPDAGNRRQIVWLSSRPDSPFDPGTTLIRGVVTRTAPNASAAGIEIARPSRAEATVGRGTTTPRSRGSATSACCFAVAVHLEAPDDGDLDATVETALTLNRGGTPHRELVVHLDHGREHVFAKALDLDGSNEPPFTDGT